MNASIREQAEAFVRMKKAALENEMSLDPGPAMPPPEPKERRRHKPVRRVFPLKRYKNSGAEHVETQ